MDADRRRIGCTRRSTYRIIQIMPHCYIYAALLIPMIASTAYTQTDFQSYMPYRSFADSPFKNNHYLYFYLEDFEDGKLNTPGVSVNQAIWTRVTLPRMLSRDNIFEAITDH
ncbi:MAG: hypothetical protein F4Z85_16945 [Gemmatimonadetes bacterium]|nr:hypothetical protein [Gemmatimonadota bacterium]